MALRWRKHPRPTGLQSIGAGPRGSTLHDGELKLATVYAARRDHRVTGWYFVSRCSGEVVNTCNKLVADEVTAKSNAMEHVKKHIAKAGRAPTTTGEAG